MFRRLELLLGVAAVSLAAQACSSSASPSASAPPKTPTPGLYSRLNPDIVEETSTYFVQRYKKDSVMKVDDKYIRNPIIGPKLEIYKEDEEYYYVYVSKPMTKEERDARREAAVVGKSVEEQAAAGDESGAGSRQTGPLDSELQDLNPKRVKGRLKLELVPRSGLPTTGQWRANFAVADMNGDGIPDIISGPFRGGDTSLHIWLGDGQGHFTPWHLNFVYERGRTPGGVLVYGGVAVGDIDGDGKMDLVTAGHTGGLLSFFGDGTGNFRVVRTGLPGKDFSSQGIALVDADGDGKLDIVAAKDGAEESPRIDKAQIQVYLYRGAKG
ncbi:MAG TPA: VCBS repeat-containing protein, partial [Thermoanaerobaculia bacterium]